jgi:hypothetical protein
VTRIEIVGRCSGYATLLGFGDFGLKTMDDRFARFRPQNSGQDLGTERVIIRELASRRSVFVQCKELNLDHFALCA